MRGMVTDAQVRRWVKLRKQKRTLAPPALRGFTQADHVNQIVSASETGADLGFMARMMALCSLHHHLASGFWSKLLTWTYPMR